MVGPALMAEVNWPSANSSLDRRDSTRFSDGRRISINMFDAAYCTRRKLPVDGPFAELVTFSIRSDLRLMQRNSIVHFKRKLVISRILYGESLGIVCGGAIFAKRWPPYATIARAWIHNAKEVGDASDLERVLKNV